MRQSIQIDPIVRHRLEQWASYSRGGLPSAGGSVWREDIYLGGMPTGRSYTALGVATRPAQRIVTEQWPEPVVEIDRIMAQILRHYTHHGSVMIECMLLYHSTDEGLRGVAAMIGKTRMTVKRRLDHGHDLVRRFLDSGTKNQ